MDLPDTANDVDLTLRHVSRQFPDQFARVFLPPGSVIDGASWLDTQLTQRQRRLDRALDVVANGARRLLHVEWQLDMAADVPFRLYEYHVLLALAVAAEAPAGVEPPPIETRIVLLSGREEPWPAEGEYRTSPSEAPFSGVRYRIEPVYQRTVAELAARDSALWLIFAPLAVDADAAQMEQVVKELRERSTKREYEDLTVALTVMADTDKRRRGLRPSIMGMLKEEAVMASWVYTQGFEKGVEQGRAQGVEQGRAQGVEQGVEVARRSLVLLYEDRFGTMSAPLRIRVDATRELEQLERWFRLTVRGNREEVDRELSADKE